MDIDRGPEDGAELLKIGDHLSQTERRSMLAERDTRDRYLASFLKDQTGGVFSARINGLSKSGIFVRLDETGADGLIPSSYLHDDRYKLNNERNKLTGQFSKMVFTIGASVLIQLREANPLSGTLIFNLIEYEKKIIPAVNKKRPRIKNRTRRKRST